MSSFGIFLIIGALIAVAYFMAKDFSQTDESYTHKEDHKSAKPDLSSLSASDVGRAIALSLADSCKARNMSNDELRLVEKLDCPTGHYYDELMLLAASAQDFAIFRLLKDHPRQQEVSGGYKEVWNTAIRTQGPNGEAFFRKYIDRTTEYAHASMKRHPGLAISPVALVFGSHLGEPKNIANILAISEADQIYNDYALATEIILKEARLI